MSAEGAHCAAEQDQYWEMHDAIFESFDTLNEIETEDEEAAIASVIEVGLALGTLEEEPFRECVESERYRPIVGALAQQAMNAGVEVTPTILIINGDYQEAIPGFLPYEDFEPILAREWSRHLGTPIPPTATPEPTPLPEPESEEGADEGGETEGEGG